MEHLAVLYTEPSANEGKNGTQKTLLTRAIGRFYTHGLICAHLVSAMLRALTPPLSGTLEVVEPFCGDGRLICSLLEASSQVDQLRRLSWNVEIWDCDGSALEVAKERIREVARRQMMKVRLHTFIGDSFLHAPRHFGRFQLCITNPPWDVLKPDRREVAVLSEHDRALYTQGLKRQDDTLSKLYPLSRPLRKFSGWGTNLARCGAELALRLTMPNGVCGLVSPASLLADQMSEHLRRWIFKENTIHDIAYYVAEARLFDGVDQPSITLVASAGARTLDTPVLSFYNREREKRTITIPGLDWKSLEENGFVLPLQFGASLIQSQSIWKGLPRFADLEGDGLKDLWAGRELDETDHRRFLANEGVHPFVKGRMIRRFGIAEEPSLYVRSDGPRIPKSVDFYRLAWRDVARPSQKRRVHATIIPPGWVSGNSLHVAYFRDNNIDRLKALLGIINSFVFEAQVRGYLATGHISLGAVRQVRVPELDDQAIIERLARSVDACLNGDGSAMINLEAYVSRLYRVSQDDFSQILSCFDKLNEEEISALLSSPLWKEPRQKRKRDDIQVVSHIPNHYSPSLSELDLMIVHSVPPGGNWKNIPESVPSQRLRQIRESFAAGDGSRSTYYGRLRPDAPSYTISTYISRPGNGCHIHYDYVGGQHRVISQREAARLQSFPDSFVFLGNRGSINQQIGNAVPPLLGYHIAKALPYCGQFVDLFSGAGGLALGFIWAGWEPIVANDIQEAFLDTYRMNVHKNTVCGDIRKTEVFEMIIERCRQGRKGKKRTPLFVLGGPPCQGFSTAGNKRTMEDERNWLFKQYKAILETIGATGFVFENVPGLLNMEGGKVFQMIADELRSVTQSLSIWKLKAEEFAIPQRRTRVILVGDSTRSKSHAPPPPVTRFGAEGQQTLFGDLVPAVTVAQALSDLPPLSPGEDGSSKDYLFEPQHPYQMLMRSRISPEEYLKAVRLLH
jgi:Alw26I/Eco31I/Esp3I family type II restriction m6 adenine DNA methyltransferase